MPDHARAIPPIALAATLASVPSAAAMPLVPGLASELASIINAHPDSFPEGVGIVLCRGGRVIHRQVFLGLDEGTPIPIASSSKWISGLAIATLLVEDRGLSLDTPAGALVPSFAARPDKAGLTVGQFFSHTSGLPEEPTYNRRTNLTMAQAVNLIAGVDLVATPGDDLWYGGLGMHVASYMATLVDGRAWSDFASARLLRPLGMASTDYFAFTEPPGTPTENPNPAGSIRTTIDDYTAFMLAMSDGGLLRGVRAVDRRAYDVILQDLAGPDIAIVRSPYDQYEAFVPGAGSFRTGFGCFIDPARIRADGSVGWATSAGAFGTNAWIDRDRGITGVFFTLAQDRVYEGRPVTYNPATRIFLEQVRPAIEAAIPVSDRPPLYDPDLTRDGVLDVFDILAWFALFEARDPASDIDRDGRQTVFDIIRYFEVFARIDR